MLHAPPSFQSDCQYYGYWVAGLLKISIACAKKYFFIFLWKIILWCSIEFELFFLNTSIKTYISCKIFPFFYREGNKGITGFPKSKNTLGNSLHSLYTQSYTRPMLFGAICGHWFGLAVWFRLVSFHSIRFDSIRCVVSFCWFWFLFCSVRYDAGGSISFFTFLLRSQAGSFILSKVQFIAKWNAAIPAPSSQPPASRTHRLWFVWASKVRFIVSSLAAVHRSPAVSTEFFIHSSAMPVLTGTLFYLLFTSIVAF